MLSACSQGRLAPRPARCWPGRCAAAARPAAICVGQHLPGRYQVRLPALELSRPHIHARPMHIHAWPSHYRSPLLTLLSRALSQRLASVSDVSSGSGSDGTAARGLCVWSVRVCVHCGQLEPQRFRQRKPRSISLKSARMRAKTPKFSLALRGVASRRDAAKKS